MEVFVDKDRMALSGISPQTVAAMAKANELGDVDKWPVYKTTGLPDFRLPASFIRRGKDHPEWDLKRLIEYRVAFRAYTDAVSKRKQRVVFLYRPEAHILFVLYVDSPKKSSDPNSPF